MINFSPLYDGQKYECECGYDSIRFKNICQHLQKMPVIFNCKNCNSKKIMQNFQDDKKIENYLENHECSDVNEKLTCNDSGLGSNLEPGSEKVVESMNLIDQNQKNQEDYAFSRNKRSSEASANENPVKRSKYGNTGYGVSSRGIQK